MKNEKKLLFIIIIVFEQFAYSNELQTMEEDTTQLPVYSSETHWQHKKFVFHEIENHQVLTR